MSKIEKTRPQFVYEVRDLMKEHNLNERQVIQIFALLHGISWELPAEDNLVLINKNLLKPGNQVNIKVLFRREEDQQQMLKFNFNSKAKVTEETITIAENLEKEFVPEDWLTDVYVKRIADEYFSGDLTLARYFMIFKAMFPVKDLKQNKKWNVHFRMTYEDSTRWSSSYLVPKKFAQIYAKKDIGLFLSGLYYAIKDSINPDIARCFMTKPEKFLLDYEQWYDLAKTKLEQAKKKKKPLKSL